MNIKSIFSEIMKVKYIALLCLSCILLPMSTLAQDAPSATTSSADAAKAKVKKEKPKEVKLTPGVIANTAKFRDTRAVDVNSGDAAPGDKPSAISARISQKGDRCVVTLKNSDEEAGYSVKFRVIGTNKDGRESLRKSFSASLGPSKSTTKNFACKRGLSMSVVLRSGKKLGA